jgi:DNA-binding IclR family transcriptional regulator
LIFHNQAVRIQPVTRHEEPDEHDGAQGEAPAQGEFGVGNGAELANAPRSTRGPANASVSLRNGLAILSLFSAERPWWRIGEIADAIELSPFDTHLQVTSMRRMNFIQEGPQRRYGLGPGPPDPTVAIRAMGIARHTRAHLVALQRLARCPVTLAMLDGMELVVVDRAVAPSSPRLEMTIDLYRRLPAYATALGKVLLAYLPEHREQALVGEMTLEALTPFTITDKRRLLKDLQRVRSCAIAIEDREHLPHRRCIAAPVRGAHHRVIAAVGLTIADPDTPLKQLVDRYSAPVGTTAARLSDALRHAQVDGSDLDWPRL